MNFIKKHKSYILVILALAGVGYFTLAHRIQTQEANLDMTNIEDASDVDYRKIAEAIKEAESQQTSRIGESPTDEQIYTNPFVTHIRTALNNYLSGSGIGIEDKALDDFDIEPDDTTCGLNSFDKSYYKSKFIVFRASDNEYGGVQTYVVFVDKPDTLFWVWTYLYAGEGDEYVLRGFCRSGPSNAQRKEFSEVVKEAIRTSGFSL